MCHHICWALSTWLSNLLHCGRFCHFMRYWVKLSFKQCKAQGRGRVLKQKYWTTQNVTDILKCIEVPQKPLSSERIKVHDLFWNYTLTGSQHTIFLLHEKLNLLACQCKVRPIFSCYFVIAWEWNSLLQLYRFQKKKFAQHVFGSIIFYPILVLCQHHMDLLWRL